MTSTDFFSWFDAKRTEMEALPHGKAMLDKGWTIDHTGGGCLCWAKHAPDGNYVWVCDLDNSLGDSANDKYIVGLYAPEGEPFIVNEAAHCDNSNLTLWPAVEIAETWFANPRKFLTNPRLTWFELSKLQEGTRVFFVEPYDIYPECIVPAGMEATIKENGLNDIWGGMLVTPDDENVRAALNLWDGNIQLGYNEGLDPGADAARNRAWQSLSPLMVLP